MLEIQTNRIKNDFDMLINGLDIAKERISKHE